MWLAIMQHANITMKHFQSVYISFPLLWFSLKRKASIIIQCHAKIAIFVPLPPIPSRSRSRQKASRHADAVHPPPTHCVTLKSTVYIRRISPLQYREEGVCVRGEFPLPPQCFNSSAANLGVCGGESICPTPTPHLEILGRGKLGNLSQNQGKDAQIFLLTPKGLALPRSMSISPNWAPLSGYFSLKNRKSSIFMPIFGAREFTILVAWGTCAKTQPSVPQSSIVIASQTHAKLLLTLVPPVNNTRWRSSTANNIECEGGGQAIHLITEGNFCTSNRGGGKFLCFPWILHKNFQRTQPKSIIFLRPRRRRRNLQ